jgi:hypothetical protein
MKKEKTRAWYKKNWADVWFSRFIRERDKRCYTCDTTSTKLQCGHFVPRQYLATRYSEINNHAQCYACNMLYGGQPSKYSLNLIRDYGQDVVTNLENSRHLIIRDMDYKRIGDEYKLKYEQLVKENNEL